MIDAAIYLTVFLAGGAFGVLAACLLFMGRDN